MKNWEKLEINVCNYLSDNISMDGITFHQTGSSNANQPDIIVKYQNSDLFSIECKSKSSQSSQFVVLNDIENSNLYFSDKNTTDPASTTDFINYLNDNYETMAFKDSESGSKPLTVPQHWNDNRVINHLATKSKLIVTSESTSDFDSNSPLAFFEPSELPTYFNITSTYRSKRCGTSNLAASKREYLEDMGLEISVEGKKTFVFDPDSSLSQYFGDNDELYLNPEKDGLREVRKRSSTKNANVIFTLKLKPQSITRETNLDVVRDMITQHLNLEDQSHPHVTAPQGNK